MIVSGDEMRALEQAAFARGIAAESLMEEAGAQIAHAVRQYFLRPGAAWIFYGKGHNGGDALVAARQLARAGWKIVLRPLERDLEKLSELTGRKLAELSSTEEMPLHHPEIILDGLLGLGARGPLRDEVRALTREINERRRQHHARVFALDLPTGLDGETGAADPDCVVADFTLAIGFAKRGLVAESAANFVGRLAVLPLADLATERAGDEVATPENLATLVPLRKFETHKNNYGRLALVSGSTGFTGAAALVARGALRAGAGLISLYAPSEIYDTLAVTAPAEVMVQPVKKYTELLDAKFDVLAVGPGLGTDHADEILALIEQVASPMIIDAEALNILAKTKKIDLLRACAGPRLLTPHPGEMARLFDTRPRTRAATVRDFTAAYPVTLLLKGARTIIGEHGRPLSYNSTGSPGMATGGMGDVLTGVCAALAGRSLALYDAARLGAWLCGRAAELAIFHGSESEESLAAIDIPRHLGAAFQQLRAGGF